MKAEVIDGRLRITSTSQKDTTFLIENHEGGMVVVYEDYGDGEFSNPCWEIYKKKDWEKELKRH